MNVVKISSAAEFADYIAKDKLTVVDFFATWCPPCRSIAPWLEEQAKDLPYVQFLKVDVDEQNELAREHNIKAMPTFIFFKNEEKITGFAGADQCKILKTIQANK